MSNDREPITAADAPPPAGPYAHGVRTGDLLFCSGQIGIDPKTGELIGPSAGDQTGRCLENLAAVCHAAGTSLANAVRLTVYLTDISAFNEINEVYSSFFESDPPARVTVGVDSLPLGAKVEVDAVVALGD